MRSLADFSRGFDLLVIASLFAHPAALRHGHASLADRNQAIQNQDECGLPAPLRALVQRQWPGWKVLDIADLSSEDQNLWTYARGRVCPGVTPGHFLNAREPSYAIAVIRGHQEAVLLAYQSESKWQLSTVMPPTHVNGLRVIWLAKPARYTDKVNSRKIQATMDSIGFEELGADVTIFVRQGNRFVPVRISQ